jgi:RimK family alpha-L-glutamate ligase
VDEMVVVHYASQRAANWELFLRAARDRGVRLWTWEPHRIALVVSDDETTTHYDGRPVRPAILLHRTVSPFQGMLTAAARVWTAAGAVVLNDIDAAFRARDKVLTTLALRDARVPVVRTTAFDEPDQATLRGLPAGDLIVKPAHGVRGEGIETFRDPAALSRAWALSVDRSHRETLEGYHLVREHYLAQPLVRGGGADLRAYVVGDACVALMRRRAKAGEVRANMELGATAEPLDVTHPAATIAVAALRACGLDYGGVDLIEDEAGVVRVLEVDAWAGFAHIAQCTGVDVAGAILELAAGRAP